MNTYIDLRGTPCPVNLIRCRLALEKLFCHESLQVDIDKGEPEEMILPGLKKEGYVVEILFEESHWLRLSISSNAP